MQMHLHLWLIQMSDSHCLIADELRVLELERSVVLGLQKGWSTVHYRPLAQEPQVQQSHTKPTTVERKSQLIGYLNQTGKKENLIAGIQNQRPYFLKYLYLPFEHLLVISL